MSNAIISYGATVERSTDGTAWEEIPECKSLAVPTITQEYAEVTNLDSVDGYREYVRGMKDAGEITLSCNYTPEGWDQQTADMAEADSIQYRVTLKPAPNQATGDAFTFRGFPTATLVDNGIGEALGMDINIRTTGNVTRAAGTAAA